MRFYAIHTLSDKLIKEIIDSLYEKYTKKQWEAGDSDRFKAYIREQNRRLKKSKNRKLQFK